MGPVWPSLVIAITSVIGSLGATVLLGFRVGRLVGQVEGFIGASTADRGQLHGALGALERSLDDHINWHLTGRRP